MKLKKPTRGSATSLPATSRSLASSACPHASGNLSAGTVHRRVVTCPVHSWKFNLDTGYCVGTNDVILKRYACQVQDGTLMADLSKPLRLAPPPTFDF